MLVTQLRKSECGAEWFVEFAVQLTEIVGVQRRRSGRRNNIDAPGPVLIVAFERSKKVQPVADDRPAHTQATLVTLEVRTAKGRRGRLPRGELEGVERDQTFMLIAQEAAAHPLVRAVLRRR